MGLEEARKLEIVSVNVQDVVIWWLNIQKKEMPFSYLCGKSLQVDLQTYFSSGSHNVLLPVLITITVIHACRWIYKLTSIMMFVDLCKCT